MSKLVHNERTKMIATHFNNLAVASVVTGVLIPAVQIIVTAAQGAPITLHWKMFLPFAFGLLFQSLFLVLSNRTLGSLEE